MSDERFSRKCPKCEVEMWYQTKKGMLHAEAYRGVCKECRPKKVRRSTTLRPDVIRLSAEGRNNIEIAIELKVAPATVSRVLHEYGLESSHDFGDLKGEWLDKLRAAFEAGKSNDEIGIELKLPPKTVDKYRTRLGCKAKSFYDREIVLREVTARLGPQILELHAKGRKTNSIAQKFRVGNKIVVDFLKGNGLESNKCVRATTRVLENNKVIDEKSMMCYKCGEVSPIDQFKTARSRCDTCRTNSRHKLLNGDMLTYFKQRLRDLQRRSIAKGVDCTVTAQDLVEIYHEQEGKCFYTGQALVPRVGQGYLEVRQSVSIDKIIPEYGYVRENTVICSFRANTIKQDMNLKEMHYWFNSKIYEKIKNKVFNLVMENF